VDVVSAREREIIRHVAFGHRDVEVAGRLGISPHTVRTHVHNILKKVGMTERRQLAGFALRVGIV
jgi:DNA-binding CsgD family transcriptional regulator